MQGGFPEIGRDSFSGWGDARPSSLPGSKEASGSIPSTEEDGANLQYFGEPHMVGRQVVVSVHPGPSPTAVASLDLPGGPSELRVDVLRAAGSY